MFKVINKCLLRLPHPTFPPSLSFPRCQKSIWVWRCPLLSSAGSLMFLSLLPDRPSTHAEAEAPVLWPPVAKSRLIGKDPDAGKDWGQEEKGVTEDEMVRKRHWLSRHESEQTLGDGEGQGSLACCSLSLRSQRVRYDRVTNTCTHITAGGAVSVLGQGTKMLHASKKNKTK